MEYWRPDRALVVAAHPDDIEFGCAGTVARWVQEGAHVAYCLVTNGAAGSSDPEHDAGTVGGAAGGGGAGVGQGGGRRAGGVPRL